MKKILLLAMLLGLTGCGNNNQSDTQSNNQASTLQKPEAVPAVAKYSLAASPRTMGAVAPLAGWSVTNSTVMGASILIDAVKGSKISAALISPNAKQVAEVLRGGAAGVALTIAVDQLLSAVDWVMDPANNQIKYKVPSGIPTDKPKTKIYYRLPFNYPTYLSYDSCKGYFESMASIDKCLKNKNYDDYCIKKYYSDSALKDTVDYIEKKDYNFETTLNVSAYIVTKEGANYKGIEVYVGVNIDNVDPPSNIEKTIPLETVAEKVISNADASSLDAQVATNLAAQNILNDVVQAEPVVQELENNASEKCDENTNPSCKKECDPPAGVKFNKVTHFERHGRDPDINVGSHGCMAKTGSPVHWHYEVNHQLPDGRCFLKGHNFGGCGVAP